MNSNGFDVYSMNDKMSFVINDEYKLLLMMSRFGIPLGVGELTIKQVCENCKVDVMTFLAVVNYLKFGKEAIQPYINKISIASLTSYLEQSHNYYLSFLLPNIRRNLLESLDYSSNNEVAYLIIKFFDNYMADVSRHMRYETDKVFKHIHEILNGSATKFNISQFTKSHEAIDKRLKELKNVIIKYYTSPDSKFLLHNVLFNIFLCEEDLQSHCNLENDLYIPAIKNLECSIENKNQVGENNILEQDQLQSESLTEREIEVLTFIVKGRKNKDISSELFISLNTVATHRKNISRKLNIHSVVGLTIYAISQGIIHLEDVKMV